jgi:predicted proteasome-type protease
MSQKQNLTVSLERETIQKAKVLAARRNTSVTRLLADYVEEMVAEDERYEAARKAALDYMDKGFPMGGQIAADREDWHER